MNVTPHFTVEEFACADGTPYPSEWIDERLCSLCETLEVIRERVGTPLVIVSGYRSLEYNRRVRGARHSQHVQGRAADIRSPTVSAARVHELVLELALERIATGGASRIPFLGGLGKYPGFTHVDVRPRGGLELARWSG